MFRKKNIVDVTKEAVAQVINEVEGYEQERKPEKSTEEWIWVDGYKGTNADMTCRDFQFELGKQYDMPEDEKILECTNGFHLCLKLEDVFEYYDIGEGHRFFKVRALVQAADVAEYGKSYSGNWLLFSLSIRNKLVAKSIEFVEELSIDEIFKGSALESYSEADKRTALTSGIDFVLNQTKVQKLVDFGYSLAFAEYIVQKDKYSVAYAVGSQEDLSMDMKVLMIMNG